MQLCSPLLCTQIQKAYCGRCRILSTRWWEVGRQYYVLIFTIRCVDFYMYTQELWLKKLSRTQSQSAIVNLCVSKSFQGLSLACAANFFFISWPDFVGSCDYCGNFLLMMLFFPSQDKTWLVFLFHFQYLNELYIFHSLCLTH